MADYIGALVKRFESGTKGSLSLSYITLGELHMFPEKVFPGHGGGTLFYQQERYKNGGMARKRILFQPWESNRGMAEVLPGGRPGKVFRV